MDAPNQFECRKNLFTLFRFFGMLQSAAVCFDFINVSIVKNIQTTCLAVVMQGLNQRTQSPPSHLGMSSQIGVRSKVVNTMDSLLV